MNQCTHCELMGNYEGCKAAECGKHEDWIVREHKKHIAALEAQLAEAEKCLKECHGEAMNEAMNMNRSCVRHVIRFVNAYFTEQAERKEKEND
jgi:hypothetical protein